MKKRFIELKVKDIIWFLDLDGTITEFIISSIIIDSKYFFIYVNDNSFNPFEIPISYRDKTIYEVSEEINYLLPGIYLNKEDLVKELLQGSKTGTMIIKNIENSLYKLGKISLFNLLYTHNFIDTYGSGPKKLSKIDKNE